MTSRPAFRTFIRCVVWVAACAVLPGCNSGLVTVKGKLTKNGGPIGKGVVEMQLEPVGDVSDMYVGNVLSSGSFHVPGKTGKGIPPGKYRISITHRPGYQRGSDKLEGRFSGKNAPTFDITGQYLEIDVGKPGG